MTSSATSTADNIKKEPWFSVHKAALENNEKTYIDPATGYLVMTEVSHRERGYCCGNICRHCPYDKINVGKPDQIKSDAKKARALKKASGASTSASASASASDSDSEPSTDW